MLEAEVLELRALGLGFRVSSFLFRALGSGLWGWVLGFGVYAVDAFDEKLHTPPP